MIKPGVNFHLTPIAENALTYLKWASKPGIFILRVLALAMGLMATINLIAIVLLSGLVVKLTKDYFAQNKTRTPIFNSDDYPEVQKDIDLSVWDEKPKQD